MIYAVCSSPLAICHFCQGLPFCVVSSLTRSLTTRPSCTAGKLRSSTDSEPPSLQAPHWPAKLNKLCKAQKHLHAGPSPAPAVYRRRFLQRIRIRDNICKAKQHLQASARKAEQATPCLSYTKSLVGNVDPHTLCLSRRARDPKI